MIGTLAFAGFSASGCSSPPLSGAQGQGGDAGVGGAAGRGGAAGGLAGTGVAGGFAGAAVAGADGGGTAGGGGSAGADGWPATLRLVNAGTSDVVLPELPNATCGFSISAAAAGASAAQQTSATPPDSWCGCDRCMATGRRLCETVDPICDGPPTKLVAGAHLDLIWDGRVAVVLGPPPAGSACPTKCDHWEDVAAGSYVFTIQTLSGSYTAQATVPAASGVILLTINN